MHPLQVQAVEAIPQPARPDRWDPAIVAGYIYELLRGRV